MIPGMASGSEEEQMTMVQPAAVAMRAAVSLVTMPPVPHCDSVPEVSTCKGNGLPSTSCSCLGILPIYTFSAQLFQINTQDSLSIMMLQKAVTKTDAMLGSMKCLPAFFLLLNGNYPAVEAAGLVKAAQQV